MPGILSEQHKPTSNSEMIDRLTKVIDSLGQTTATGGLFEIELSPTIKELPAFLSPIRKTVDDIARETIDSVRKVTSLRHNYPARLYEAMLSEAAELLNRCEGYRREAEAAAAQGIRDAFELVCREAIRANQRKLLQQTSTVANASRAAGYQRAAQIFAGSKDATPKGHAALAETESAFVVAFTKTEDERHHLSEFSLDIEEVYDEALKFQRQLAGGALNNVDRYQRLCEFFTEDLAEAYERLMAAEIGLGFHDIRHDPLPQSGDRPFDGLIHWVRDAMREVEAVSLLDEEIVVPLLIGGHDTLNTVVSREAARDALKKTASGEIDFLVMGQHMRRGFDHPRILSVGLCFLHPEDWTGDMSKRPEATCTFSATVWPPSQEYLEKKGWDERPVPLSIGVVGLVSPEGSYMEVGGPLVAFAQPFGRWRVIIDASGMNSTNVIPRDTDRIIGLVMYLRLMVRRDALGMLDLP